MEFSGFRKLIWPIHSHELKKFLPMGIMMFCILFIYNILRDTKDAILVNAPGAGAESLAFAKGIGVTFSAILFMVIYTKAANLFNREGLFYATALPFLLFFGLYPYCIYPFVDSLHMNLDTIYDLQQAYPAVKWLVPLVGNWTFTLFYIMSELWGSAILSLLFWQFANSITPVHEARRFYGMFGFVGNFGLLFAGPMVIYVSHVVHGLSLSRAESTGMMLQHLMAFVILAGALLLAAFYWMNRYVLTDPRFCNPESPRKKEKLSVMESFKYILGSSYLGLIAILVMAYGISMNLFEAVWKGQVAIAYPTEVEFNRLMGGLTTVTGATAVILMLVGSNLLRKFSWQTCALIMPVVLIMGSMVFFSVIAYNNSLLPEGMKIADAIKQGLISKEFVVFGVGLGIFINAFSKAVKYSLFDPTKEMAYIPLDPELKVKGKAAVDVIGGRGGKSAGAYIQMGLLTLSSGSALYQLVPLIAPIVVGIVFLWILSVFGLSRKFRALTEA